jgi:neutral ceramidase
MLKAGAAMLDITPPLGTKMPGLFHERTASEIHDPLHVRAFCVQDGTAAVAMAVCDLIGVKRVYLDRAKARIAKETDLPPERVLISCTHTHTGAMTGDDAYTEHLIGRIADAVRLARDRVEPAEVGWAGAAEERLVFNRRWRMADGTFRTNPGLGNPDAVAPGGPADPEVGAICMRRPGGSTIGFLGNYCLHYVGAGDQERQISADYFGYFSRQIQALRGESFVAALGNGTCGDINNIDVRGAARNENRNYQHAERVATRVAAAAFWAWNEMAYTGDAPVGGAMAEVFLSRRPISEADLSRAREILDRKSGTMEERGFAMHLMRTASLPERTPTWVQALRVGDLGIVGMPGEPFAELGLEIKRRSPFAKTFVFELANDAIGYLPVRRAFDEGGYEVVSTPFAPGTGEQLVETALRLLETLR